MAARPDVTSLLPTIKVPTLVLVGEHDAISPPAEMKEIADAIPGAEFVVDSPRRPHDDDGRAGGGERGIQPIHRHAGMLAGGLVPPSLAATQGRLQLAHLQHPRYFPGSENIDWLLTIA